ncbi:hypothetical protein HF251_16635 [Rhizobium leguminosarum]|uniref:hypothetical protein n=1 Tax=Rhizobium leguminosarum TaxID=384 RepID=UPI001C916169|nr:hypothetical protein [Rhizobium leguminosarum]MBY2964296.1 hypothetical protein [Rhizobium leguminosarum]
MRGLVRIGQQVSAKLAGRPYDEMIADNAEMLAASHLAKHDKPAEPGTSSHRYYSSTQLSDAPLPQTVAERRSCQCRQRIGKLPCFLMRQSTETDADRSRACAAADAFRQSDLKKVDAAASDQIEPGRSLFKLAIPFLRGNHFRVRRYIGLYMERYNARYIHD